jgi:hypothetical protein
MKITLDTNILPADDLLIAPVSKDWEFAVVSVTEREVKDTDIQIGLKPLGKVLETGIWGESNWNNCVWGSEETRVDLDKILSIISHGSFPTNRESLSTGEHHQLRDAMIFQAHIRESRDIFVTKDSRGFISNGRREELEEKFHTRIMTPEEFVDFCRGKSEK